MPEVMKAKRESIERAVAAYLAAGGTDEAGIRATLEAWHEEERFEIGDEVICAHGSLAGYVVAIHGHDAVIAWSCRGKSAEHFCDLTHVEHHDGP
jgi:hypothetical protein